MSGGKGGGSQTQTTQTRPPDYAAPALNAFTQDLISQIFSGGGQAKAPDFFPGSTVAGRNEDELASQDLVRQAAGGQAGQDWSQNVQGGFQNLLSRSMNPLDSPEFQSAVDAAINPVRRQLQESVLPGIDSSAISSGGYGGARQGIAQGQAIDNFARQAMDTTSRLAFQTQQAGLDRGSQLLANSGNIFQQSLAPAQALAGVGEAERSYEQALIDEQIARFNQEEQGGYQRLIQALGLAQGSPGGTQTVTGPGTESGGVAGALGGASTMAGLLGGLGQAGILSAGTASGPVGWGLMGVGALAGLFG